jgi:hypothetical protein
MVPSFQSIGILNTSIHFNVTSIYSPRNLLLASAMDGGVSVIDVAKKEGKEKFLGNFLE